MIVVMKAHATEAELAAVTARVEALGYRPHVIRGVERNVVGCVGVAVEFTKWAASAKAAEGGSTSSG